jgi:hypothetical protein
MLSHALLGTALAVSIAQTTKSKKKIRRLSKLVDANRKIAATNEVKAAATILYLVDLLEKNGVQPTEFDIIALSNIVNA